VQQVGHHHLVVVAHQRSPKTEQDLNGVFTQSDRYW
jgi:hypothetical protein